MRREIPLLITATMGIFLIIQTFIPHPPINKVDQLLNDYALIVIVFTMILGLLNLFYMNLKKVTTQRPGWGYSAVTILAFAITAFMGFVNPGEDAGLTAKLLESNSTLLKTVANDVAAGQPDLDERQAERFAYAFTKLKNPGFVPDAERLEELGTDIADLEELSSYGRIRAERFAAIFDSTPITRERFDALSGTAIEHAGDLIDAVLPLGRAVHDYAADLQDVLADNRTVQAELIKAAGEPDFPKPERFLPVARQAAAPMLPGVIDYGERKVLLGDIGEAILVHLVTRGVENIAYTITARRELDPDEEPDEKEVLNAFRTKNALDSLFQRMDNSANPLALKVAGLAKQTVETKHLSERAFTDAIEALFGESDVEPKFYLHPLEKGSGFQWIFDNIYDPLAATMFALLAFFIASAAYRAFRVRSAEAALLLGAGFIVMLGQIPFGNYLTVYLPDYLQMSDIADWIMMYPNMASQRAIMIGVALGVISTALKIILGLERGYLGGEE